MKQAELNRQVAKQLDESICEIARRGFSLVEEVPGEPRFLAKDVSSWLGNSVPVAMRHYAMATEASFLEACDPKGRTVSHRQDAVGAARGHHESREGGGNPESQENGGCIGGCISKLSGAIEPLAPNEETPVSQCKTGVFVVQDSSGNYYLMGDEGLEP